MPNQCPNDEAPGAYLDNCVTPTGEVRQQLSGAEREAFLELIRRENTGEIRLVTSERIRDEIAKTKDPETLADLEIVFALYARIPIVPEERSQPRPVQRAGSSGLTSDPIVQEELLGKLSFLRHPMDRMHVYQASANGCEYLVTLDGEMLEKAPRIRAVANVIVYLPSELLAVLAASS